MTNEEIKKYKINMDGFMEQDLPGQCPECGFEVIGWGLYPVGGFRSKMKPNMLFGIGYECPKCFTKSCCHNTEKYCKSFIEDAIMFKKEGFTRERLQLW